MTPLFDKLVGLIRDTGPISIAEYMAICLSDSRHGYYATRDPLGAAGDFTTAPEISQMFGELVGLSLVQAWADQGAPDPFCLVEFGPGRGTLMADILRASAVLPGFGSAARVVLVETSPALRRKQADTLEGREITWLDDATDLPELPLFVIANEFFDALPIRQFERTKDGWREVLVGLDDNGLTLGYGAEHRFPQLAHRLKETTPGDVVETCSAAQAMTHAVAERVVRYGGAALFIDYGESKSLGDTFQAVRDHHSVSPFASPGDSDLTAHVDFGALARIAQDSGAACLPLTSQGVFLERLGITARARQIANSLSDEPLDSHVTAHRRLTHPDEMGTVFKVFGFTSADAPPLPGFLP